MLNVTNIPAPRVSIIDERTGLISREWYRFFLNLFTLAGQGNNQTNLDDLQVGPPAQNINILVPGSPTDLAPPPAPPVSIADTQAILPPSIQFSPDNSQALLPSVVFPSADDSQALLPSVVQAIVQSYADLAPPIIPPNIATNGTVTSVDVSGGTTGMSFTGGPITTSGTITMSGTLGTANGGTGVTSTASNGQLLIGNGSGYSLSSLTAGTNITITNSSGGITIAATGGTGTVTSVAASGGTTGLTFSGSPITTSGTLTLGGTLAAANGGTGASSLTGAGIVTLTDNQVITGQKNFTNYSCTYAGATYATTNAYFGENTSYATVAGVNGVVLGYGSTYPGLGRFVVDNTGVRPFTDNAFSNGNISWRWSNVYTYDLAVSNKITSGTWNGSIIGVGYGGTGASSLTGAGIVTTTDTQTISGVKTFSSTSNAFVGATYKTSNAYFYENTSYAVLGGVNGVTLSYGAHPGTGGFVLDSTGIRPFTDNTYRNGNASWRWTEIFAVTGTINTSDASQKQQVRELSDAEQRAAQRVKKLIRAFKWNDAVEAKGEDARIHFGVIAQDVQEAFAAEGLDASKYGLFCSDTWTNSDGSSQTRLGVRYSELLAFVIAAL